MKILKSKCCRGRERLFIGRRAFCFSKAEIQKLGALCLKRKKVNATK